LINHINTARAEPVEARPRKHPSTGSG